jgi:CHAT domain-containing protein/predicted negative regulator of RcsB-dependent stress response
MSTDRRAPLFLLALSLGLISSALAQSLSSSNIPTSYQSSAEPAVRALVERYFSFYTGKDLDGLMSLWSEKSPDYASVKESLRRQFTTEDYRFGSPAISRFKVEGEKASLRATISLTTVNQKSNRRRETWVTRDFGFVLEEGKWRIWQCAAAENDLADALVKAKSEEARTGLMSADKELVTAELVYALNSQGSSIFNRGDYPLAMTACQIALKIAGEIGDKPGVAAALYSIANIYWAQTNYAQAMENYQKSLAISETLGDQYGIARAVSNMGNIYAKQNNYTKALENYQKALSLLEPLDNKTAIAGTLNNIAVIYFKQGDDAQALEYYRKIITMSESLGDLAAVARATYNMANVLCQQGYYQQALESYKKSLAIQESLDNRRDIAMTLSGIGGAYYDQSNYAQALVYAQKSLAIYEAIDDKVGISNVLNDFGNIYLLQGDYVQALQYYQKSLSISESQKYKYGMAVALENIGHVNDNLGNYTQALEYLKKSLLLEEVVGEKEAIARALKKNGTTYNHQGNYAQAMEHYQKSLAIEEALGDQGEISDILRNIADVHEKQGHYAQALEFAERATVLARRIGEIETLWRARLTAGSVYRILNQPSQAREAFEEAITTIEMLRVQVAGGEGEQQRFFESKVGPYHEMVGLLIAQSNPVEALTYAERAKSRVLLDVLKSGRVNVTKAMTKEEQEQERKLNQQLISLNTQIYRDPGPQHNESRLSELKDRLQSARLDFEAFQNNLYAAHLELRAQRGEAQILKIEEAADLLPDLKSALLEFVVAEDRTYLFVMTGKGMGSREPADLKAYTLELKRDDLNKQIETFRRQLADRDLGFRASGMNLYELLLKPAQAQLKGKTNLVIVPDDKLWDLPFQALLVSGRRFLLEDAAIAYAPSLTVLREMTRRRKHENPDTASATLLAIGNPLLDKTTIERAKLALRDEKLDPLPEAEQEVSALGRIYGATRSKVYVGAEAREDRVKAEAGRASVLHFATHGVLNNASPMYSHLALAQGDKNEDGLLEAWELMRMDLNADLVTLSACETARGRYGAGEGVIGLTWALFVAGVPSTVVSQWKVESASTRDLMLSFHRKLRTSPAAATKAEALRQAALKVMKNPETSHPFYWAGFVLVGDGR